ncbi:MAG: hypothetical protein ACR2OC_06865 [Solirubrobacterales bacterium]
MNRAAFYLVADSRYFLGAVGTINSLRLQGHDEPLFVLDCGLSAAQRDLLGGQAILVDPPVNGPPWMLKTIAPLAYPAETVVLLDADVIVTRSLAGLIERAEAGYAVAFRNNVDRFVPEWGELLDLGPIPRRPYVCSAFLAIGPPSGAGVLRLIEECSTRVDFGRTFYGSDEHGYPFRFPDQDVFNAVLAAQVEAENMAALETRLQAPMPFEGLRIADELAVRCVFEDGEEPYMLHHILPAKPWLEPMPDGIYPRLLRRLLIGEGLAIEVPDEELPLRFRRGALAYTERRRVDLLARARWRIGLAMDRRRG